MPLPMPEVDSDDEDYLPPADLDDPVWSDQPVQDSQEYLCIHEILRQATPSPKSNQVDIPATPNLQPNQVEMPTTPPPQSEQVEMSPQYKLMELDFPDDMPDLIGILEEVLSDFDAWSHSVLHYEW